MYHHWSINSHWPASFCKNKHILTHPYQRWLYTNCHKNPRNQKNSTLKSKHGTTKWNESTPGHCMPLHHVNCITLHPPKLHGCSSNIFETRALFVCLLQGVHVAANKMSYGSYFIFLGCFQDVLTSDPIQVKDVMQLIVCKEVMHRHVWRAWRQQIKNWKKHGRDWENAKQESSHYSIFLKMEKLRTTCKARTHSKRDITEWTIYDYIISMIYKEVQQERKLERGKRQKQVLQGTHPAKASSPTRPAWRHDMSYI